MRHKCPQIEVPPGEFTLSISCGGNVVRIKEAGRARPTPDGAVRGKVQGFSRAAQLNMLQAVHSIDRRLIEETWFATLTYPEQHHPTWATIERDRRAWSKRFFRQWGRHRAFIVWKKELTKKNVVHLHALIFWVKSTGHPVPRLKGPAGFWAWNDVAWAETANTDHPDHQRVACKVVPMHSWNGVGSYCAKYLAKPQDGLHQDTGRIWGIENRKLAATVASTDLQHLPRPVGIRFRRTLRKLQARRRQKWLVEVDGRWCPCRPLPQYPVALQVARARQDGRRVKLARPRCLVTRTATIWGQVEGTAKVEPIGQETHSYASSLHFVKEDTARALLTWSMQRWLEDVEASQDLPI